MDILAVYSEEQIRINKYYRGKLKKATTGEKKKALKKLWKRSEYLLQDYIEEQFLFYFNPELKSIAPEKHISINDLIPEETANPKPKDATTTAAPTSVSKENTKPESIKKHGALIKNPSSTPNDYETKENIGSSLVKKALATTDIICPDKDASPTSTKSHKKDIAPLLPKTQSESPGIHGKLIKKAEPVKKVNQPCKDANDIALKQKKKKKVPFLRLPTKESTKHASKSKKYKKQKKMKYPKNIGFTDQFGNRPIMKPIGSRHRRSKPKNYNKVDKVIGKNCTGGARAMDGQS